MKVLTQCSGDGGGYKDGAGSGNGYNYNDGGGKHNNSWY